MIILRIFLHRAGNAARAVECDAEFAHRLLGYLCWRLHFCKAKKSIQIPVVILDRLHTPPFFYLDVFEELCFERFEVRCHSTILPANIVRHETCPIKEDRPRIARPVRVTACPSHCPHNEGTSPGTERSVRTEDGLSTSRPPIRDSGGTVTPLVYLVGSLHHLPRVATSATRPQRTTAAGPLP